MDTAIYEWMQVLGIPRKKREHLRALITLSQFTRKAILDALRPQPGLPPYYSDEHPQRWSLWRLKKHEILMWVATYCDPEKILIQAHENAEGGES